MIISRYVEGGKYIETHTGCGSVWGQVDGTSSFSFRGIPYSVQVQWHKSGTLPTVNMYSYTRATQSLQCTGTVTQERHNSYSVKVYSHTRAT
jgi:hypothetical protein